jgi:formylglycine-generating enzyme required for sulfatase activity
VLDLAGNVSEWVEDAYHRAYYSMSPTANPPGPAAGAEHMLRGGSWEDLPVAVQTTSRAHALPKLRAGFRCASSLAGTLSISGTVRDENGYGVPGVTVSGGVSHTTSSDDGGHFSLHGLVTGTYTLTAARPLDTFSPFSQVVTIPPGANEVVFTCSSCRRFDPGEMLPIPAGDFQMGCDVFNSWGECEKDEGPLHTVSLSFYYIDEYEVSNERYAACMGAGACSPPQDSASFTRSMYFQNPDYASYPVVNVNWSQARNFCAWEGKRLPSEAEWEKAARGSLDLRRYPWGNQAPDCSRANFKLESYQPCYPDTVQVGGYPLGSSPYGIQDMAGSVWEWVNDWYASDYYCHGPEASSVDATVTCAEDDVPYLSPWPDPTGPVSGTYRVMRGGSLDLSWFGIRSSYRGGKYYSPDYASYFVGFRCASSVLTTYSASGTILDWTGRPVSGVTVSAGAGSLAVTQDDGSYTLEGLPAGKYLVKPQHDSYTFYPDHLWIQTPGPAGHQDFRAQLISTVRGRVLDGIGKPLPNVTINAGKEFHVLSGLDGTFSLYVPSPGVYTITASQAGNLFTPTLRAVIAPPGAVNQDFTCTDCPEGMLLIPAGTFYMGCDPYAQGLNCYGDQVPLHQVFLDDFFMDEYEATNSRYAACVAAGECSPPHYAASYTRNPYFGNAGFSNYPVLNVDWFQAKDMCEYEGKRLPTEGEWEKAARGSEDLRRYPWGTQAPDCTLLNYSPQTNEIDRCVGDTTEVGSYPGGASPYGILDMAGNVREWVADWYQANYYLESVFANPIGPASGPGRSVRGGALVDSAEYMEIFDRYGPAPEDWSMVSGFRCVMTP